MFSHGFFFLHQEISYISERVHVCFESLAFLRSLAAVKPAFRAKQIHNQKVFHLNKFLENTV